MPCVDSKVSAMKSLSNTFMTIGTFGGGYTSLTDYCCREFEAAIRDQPPAIIQDKAWYKIYNTVKMIGAYWEPINFCPWCGKELQ